MTCKGVSFTKFSSLPCLRYKITDIRMLKLGNVPGHEWTKRWAGSRYNDISNWDSSELRTIKVTQGYSPNGMTLVVRRFKPSPGDMLHRSWVDGTTKKSVLLPPYAIVDIEAATQAYKEYINQEGPQFFNSILDPNDRIIRETYSQAIYASNHANVSIPQTGT